MTFEIAKKRQAKAISERGKWDPLLREISRLALPQAGDFWCNPNVAYNRYRYLHDNSLFNNLMESGERIVAELMPNGQNWARVVLGETMTFLSQNEKDAANRQLDMLSSYILRKLSRTDFNASMTLASICFQTFGYCAVMPMWDPIDRKISWNNISPFDFWIERAASGKVWNTFWRVTMDYEEAKRLYPNYKRALQENSKVKICYASFAKLQDGFLRSDVWIWDEEDAKEPAAYYDLPGMPLVVGTMKSMYGEQYPVNSAYGCRWLPEAETLNLMSADYKEAVARNIYPPMAISQEAFRGSADGNLELTPNSVHFADAEDVRTTAMPITTGTDLAALAAVIDKKTETMRAETGKLNTIANPDAPINETAFSWWLAQQEQAGKGRSPKDQFKTNFLSPCIREMVTQMQMHEGVISPHIELDGEQLRIEIIGNGEAQENVNEIQKIRAIMEMLAVNPQEGYAMFDWTKAMREIIGHMGGTQWIRTPAEEKRIKQQMMQLLENGAGPAVPRGNQPASQPGAGAQQ